MVPLKTFQGLDFNKLKQIIKERDLYLWGAGILGRTVKRSLEKHGILVKSFCDKNSNLHSSVVDNLVVVSPKDIIDLVRKEKGFIIITSSQYRLEIEQECQDSGLVKSEDFLSYIHLQRPEAVIDVAGASPTLYFTDFLTNTTELRNTKYMDINLYKKIFNKLITELPSLINVYLYTWSDPFANPDLDKIVAHTEYYVPCTIATNLHLIENLEDVIKSQPSSFIILVNGYENSYELNSHGLKWKIFLNNLYFLHETIKKYTPKTHFILLYLLYRNNLNNDVHKMRDLCIKLGINFITSWAYLNPYEIVLDYCQKRKTGCISNEIIDNLCWDIDNALNLTKKELHYPCLCQRIFPIINCNTSVSLCHVYNGPGIVDNFLNHPIDEIIEIRHNQNQCRECQKYGLHRLDIDLLSKKYSNKQILKSVIKKC